MKLKTSNVFPEFRISYPIAAWSNAPRNQTVKKYGPGGKKIGNAHLRWAFSEATQLFLKGNVEGQKYLQRITNKHGKGKALSILAHKLGLAVYYMLKNKKSFDMEKFLTA